MKLRRKHFILKVDWVEKPTWSYSSTHQISHVDEVLCFLIDIKLNFEWCEINSHYQNQCVII